MNIILCGLPGSGKSTVGQLLANKLNQLFIDTDQAIELRYAQQTGVMLNCRELTRKEGESFFRKLEKEVVADLQQCSNSVISTGGGTVLDPENVQVLKSLGEIIFLKGDVQQCFTRVIQGGIPTYLDPFDPLGSYQALALRRVFVYAKACSIEVLIDGMSPQEIVEQICKLR